MMARIRNIPHILQMLDKVINQVLTVTLILQQKGCSSVLIVKSSIKIQNTKKFMKESTQERSLINAVSVENVLQSQVTW